MQCYFHSIFTHVSHRGSKQWPISDCRFDKNYFKLSDSIDFFAFMIRNIPFILYIYQYIRETLKHRAHVREERRPRKRRRRRRSLDNALDDVAINRTRRLRGCGDARGVDRVPCTGLARSARMHDARPVRHQTSYIDHIIGRRCFRYTR